MWTAELITQVLATMAADGFGESWVALLDDAGQELVAADYSRVRVFPVGDGPETPRWLEPVVGGTGGRIEQDARFGWQPASDWGPIAGVAIMTASSGGVEHARVAIARRDVRSGEPLYFAARALKLMLGSRT